jgi:hypothetical protein
MAGVRKLEQIGAALVDWRLTFACAVYNLVRLRRLRAGCSVAGHRAGAPPCPPARHQAGVEVSHPDRIPCPDDAVRSEGLEVTITSAGTRDDPWPVRRALACHIRNDGTSQGQPTRRKPAATCECHKALGGGSVTLRHGEAQTPPAELAESTLAGSVTFRAGHRV